MGIRNIPAYTIWW